jgi:hypothetical protein
MITKTELGEYEVDIVTKETFEVQDLLDDVAAKEELIIKTQSEIDEINSKIDEISTLEGVDVRVELPIIENK